MILRPALASLLLALSVPAMAADCPSDPRALAQGAASGGDLQAMKAAHGQLQRCNEGQLAQWLGRRIANAIYNRAIAGPRPDEAMLLSALDYGRPWQALASLGEVLNGRKEYAGAARRYQEALTEIDSAESTPQSPGEQVILGLRRKAEQAGLLASTYVPTTRTRDNRNAGLAAISLRGVAITAVALPVEFERDKTVFTAKGRQAMQDMIELINNESPAPASLTIEGHTDPDGSDSYNLQLSQARAKTVADMLRAGLRADRRGIRITPVGRGETRPYQPDDASKYSQTELYQMHRRVELKRP